MIEENQYLAVFKVQKSFCSCWQSVHRVTLSLAHRLWAQVLSSCSIYMYNLYPSIVAIDCGHLLNPENGQVTFIGTTLGSVANYSCNAGFILMGLPTRACGVDGSWSGEAPLCECKLPM